MSDLVLVDAADALERAADPGEFVVVALERGKAWLAEALAQGNLDALVEVRGWAATLRTATMQKQLGRDAELSATELVRRAERCIGLGIRQGQAAGEVGTRQSAGASVTRNQWGDFEGQDRDSAKPISASDLFANHSDRTGVYAITDGVTDDQFDAAITVAREEGNLSRASVIRKVRGEAAGVNRVEVATRLAETGHTTDQIAKQLGFTRRTGAAEFLRRHSIDVPADVGLTRTRRINSERIVDGAVRSVDGIGILFPQIDYSILPADKVPGWLAVLDESIRSLTTLKKNLKETSQP